MHEEFTDDGERLGQRGTQKLWAWERGQAVFTTGSWREQSKRRLLTWGEGLSGRPGAVEEEKG